MKIIILGAGEVGTGLVEYLIDENNEITIVDNDVDRLRLLQNRYDLKVVNGSLIWSELRTAWRKPDFARKSNP